MATLDMVESISYGLVLVCIPEEAFLFISYVYEDMYVYLIIEWSYDWYFYTCLR